LCTLLSITTHKYGRGHLKVVTSVHAPSLGSPVNAPGESGACAPRSPHRRQMGQGGDPALCPASPCHQLAEVLVLGQGCDVLAGVVVAVLVAVVLPDELELVAA
jgi:hypothetical protein